MLIVAGGNVSFARVEPARHDFINGVHAAGRQRFELTTFGSNSTSVRSASSTASNGRKMPCSKMA